MFRSKFGIALLALLLGGCVADNSGPATEKKATTTENKTTNKTEVVTSKGISIPNQTYFNMSGKNLPSERYEATHDLAKEICLVKISLKNEKEIAIDERWINLRRVTDFRIIQWRESKGMDDKNSLLVIDGEPVAFVDQAFANSGHFGFGSCNNIVQTYR